MGLAPSIRTLSLGKHNYEHLSVFTYAALRKLEISGTLWLLITILKLNV